MRLFGGSSQGSSNYDDLSVGLKPLPTGTTSAPAPVQTNAASAAASGSATDVEALDFARERWADEKSRYERQRLDSEFNDALNRLADIQNPFMRAGGANRVAALARRRVAEKGDLEDTYPFFVRASGHLAAALHLEEESAVRDEVHKALDMMTDFAQFEGEEGQLLIYSLLDDIAAANRSARKAFVAALARHMARATMGETGSATNYDALRALVDFTCFCPKEEDTFRCLCDLANTPDCRTQTRFQSAVGLAQALRKSVSQATSSNDALDVIYRCGERLKETATALTACLRALTAVSNEVLDTGEFGLGQWRRNGRRLQLAGTFLAGARLASAHLAGANLMDSILHGAELEGTTLIGANLFGAKLGGANLFGAVLAPEGNPGVPQGAPLVQLSGADWWRASPTSFRGAKGEAMKRWLLGRFPTIGELDSIPHWTNAPAAVASSAAPVVAESPAAAAKAGRATGGRSVRALFGGQTAAASPTTSTAVKENEREIEDDEPELNLDIRNVSTETVQVRDKALPRYGDKFHTRDLTSVQDLMADRADDDITRVGEDTVQVRTSANPNDLRANPRVSDRDLAGIQDLMKDR